MNMVQTLIISVSLHGFITLSQGYNKRLSSLSQEAQDFSLLWKASNTCMVCSWIMDCLAVHPVKTQVISSGVLWGVGDIAAQSITHSTAKKHLQARMKSLKFTGNELPSQASLDSASSDHLATSGCMDRFITHKLKLQSNSIGLVATKVAMDSLIFGPFDLLVFFAYMGFSNGKNAVQVKEDLKRDFLPALMLEGGVWPVVQVVNFRFVPVAYQLLYVNVFCLMDSAFLSWFEQQEDAPWKQWFTPFSFKKEEGQGR
ncbi:hypothetical protein RJ639_001491 [Escallonia herrerae]|uniref:Uncharacterized protein n=1 Tax=Escallonia herrerae TaxID=1293975 RepID=A0AA88X8S4_9ASTE|nr:hypothetical protein RJ639_001491 [Escallonia herrerae]